MKYKIHKHDYMVTVKFPFKERLKQLACLLLVGEIRYWLGQEDIVSHPTPVQEGKK